MGKELTSEKASRGLTEERIVHIPGLASRWIRLGNGARAHYVTSGDTGPGVLLLHGGIVGSSGTAGWRFMAPYLGQQGFRVYCPDQPSFGWSDTREEYRPTLGVIDHFRFNKAFVDALLLDKVHVSGNSMGCTNTVQFTMQYPDKVASFALIAGGVGDLVDPAKRVTGKDSKFIVNPAYQQPPFDGTEQSMRDLMAGIIYKAGQVWPELVTMRTEAALRNTESTKARVASTDKIAKDPNLSQLISTKNRFNKMTIPGIYLYGIQDVLSPVENGFAQEDVGFPNIQFFYPNDCGHQGQTDQPEMFNQVLAEFFKNGKVSWKTAEWAGVSRRTAIKPSLVEQPAGGFPKPDPNWVNQFTREKMAARSR